MTDFAVRAGTSGIQSSSILIAITPADGTDLSYTTRGIYVGGAGDISVISPQGTTITFVGVPVGTILPICVNRIKSTGTTATNLVALM
jgi:hypothetical protein